MKQILQYTNIQSCFLTGLQTNNFIFYRQLANKILNGFEEKAQITH